nr:hypothetical protein [Mumia quercus]
MRPKATTSAIAWCASATTTIWTTDASGGVPGSSIADGSTAATTSSTARRVSGGTTIGAYRASREAASAFVVDTRTNIVSKNHPSRPVAAISSHAVEDARTTATRAIPRAVKSYWAARAVHALRWRGFGRRGPRESLAHSCTAPR